MQIMLYSYLEVLICYIITHIYVSIINNYQLTILDDIMLTIKTIIKKFEYYL